MQKKKNQAFNIAKSVLCVHTCVYESVCARASEREGEREKTK